MSAPSSHAVHTSVGVIAPGMEVMPSRRVSRITAGLVEGEITYSAPASKAACTSSTVSVVPTPRQILSPNARRMARSFAQLSAIGSGSR